MGQMRLVVALGLHNLENSRPSISNELESTERQIWITLAWAWAS